MKIPVYFITSNEYKMGQITMSILITLEIFLSRKCEKDQAVTVEIAYPL